MPSGGHRPNAGRPVAHIAGQQTLFGGSVDGDGERDRRHTKVVSVEEARKRREDAEVMEESKRRKISEQAASQARADDARREMRIAIRKEKENEAAEALAALQAAVSSAPDDDDDDEDYDADMEDESQAEGEEDAGGKPRRQRQSYQPPKNSRLKNYLDGIKDIITNSSNISNRKKGRAWYPPTTCGIVATDLDPFEYCKEFAWVYDFSPFVQFDKIIEKPVKEHKCVHCGTIGTLKGNGLHYRPMHHFNNIVWLLHRRLECNNANGGCGRTFAEFHPAFLAQLPNPAIENFPFLTTASGLGLHKSMMHQFIHLCIKGVLFGTYCASINEARMVQFHQTHLSYLDVLHDVVERRSNMPGSGTEDDTFVPKPFFPFSSPGSYNGILLKPSLLRHLFIRVRTNAWYLAITVLHVHSHIIR
jgi:hypothetical protein